MLSILFSKGSHHLLESLDYRIVRLLIKIKKLIFLIIKLISLCVLIKLIESFMMPKKVMSGVWGLFCFI